VRVAVVVAVGRARLFAEVRLAVMGREQLSGVVNWA
jgi:hypothetical protein